MPAKTTKKPSPKPGDTLRYKGIYSRAYAGPGLKKLGVIVKGSRDKLLVKGPGLGVTTAGFKAMKKDGYADLVKPDVAETLLATGEWELLPGKEGTPFKRAATSTKPTAPASE